MSTSKNLGETSYKSEDMTNRLCRATNHSQFRSSGHAYSIAEYSCQWAKQIFPGIAVEAGAKVRHGGTFSPSPGEDLYDDHIARTSTYLVGLVDLMHAIRYGTGKFSGAGPQPRHVVVSHPEVRAKLGQRPDGKIKGVCYDSDGSGCQSDVRSLPPIYKLSSSGKTIPSLLVTPEVLFEIVDLLPREAIPSAEYSKQSSQLTLVLEPLIRSVSYVKSQDTMNYSLGQQRDLCRSPEFQTQAAQEDCATRIEKMESALKQLSERAESDRQHLSAQMQFYREVERMRLSKARIGQGNSPSGSDPITSPNEVH